MKACNLVPEELVKKIGLLVVTHHREKFEALMKIQLFPTLSDKLGLC